MSQSDFVSRGQALVAQGQFQEAVKVCRLGLLGAPTTVDGRVVLGQALLALGRVDEVLAEMRVATDLDGNSATAHALRGEALLTKADTVAAREALERAAQLAPGDRRIAGLLQSARSGPAAAAAPRGKPESDRTVHYGEPISEAATRPPAKRPDSVLEELDADDLVDDDLDNSAAHTRERIPLGPVSQVTDVTPPPTLLAVGDRSITVEVDPSVDANEAGDDFGDIAAPPVSSGAALTVEAARQAIRRARAAAAAQPRVTATRQIADDDLEDMDEMNETPMQRAPLDQPTIVARGKRARAPAPGRTAVDRPSGPLDEPTLMRERPVPAQPIVPGLPQVAGPETAQIQAASRQTVTQDSVSPTQLASMLAQQPHELTMVPVAHSAAATLAAMPPAVLPPVAPTPVAPSPVVVPTVASTRRTVAIEGAVPPPGQAWAQSTVIAPHANAVPAFQPQYGGYAQAHAAAYPSAGGDLDVGVAAADEPTRVPHAIDPRFAAGAVPAGVDPGAASSYGNDLAPVWLEPPGEGLTAPRPRTGVQRPPRSKLAIFAWFLVGALVIGGGVFAGLQIRGMRLRNQIVAARARATETTKTDTYKAWLAARDGLADIVRVQSTADSRAAFGRANAVLAFEFGDPEARTAAEAALASAGDSAGDSADNAVAAAYVALAHSDAKAARTAADHAVALAGSDAGALYVDGAAELAAGDVAAAVTSMKAATEHDPRPLYFVGLARAHAASQMWDDATAATTRALAASPDLPTAVLEAAAIQIESGRLSRTPTSPDVTTLLARIVSEGAAPIAEQPHGVSALELERADLALARIALVRGDPGAARTQIRAALAVGLDDQRLGEDIVDTMVASGELNDAADAVKHALAAWPTSRRAKLAGAEIAIAQGKAAVALDAIASLGADLSPREQALRGWARAQLGDLDGAQADDDAVLKKLPRLERATVGRAWLDLDAGHPDVARKRIEPLYDPSRTSDALATVYAAVLRASHDPASRDTARVLLEPIAAGHPSLDRARAQLELARLYRDLGDLTHAADAFAKAIASGSLDAKREAAELHIEDRDPQGGRDMLDELVRAAGEHPPAGLLIEAARARALVGDHAGAAAMLDAADKLPGVLRWQVDRERGRLALRREDVPSAAQFLARALDDSGDDVETMLLAADAATGDDKHGALITRLAQLAHDRLGTQPEGQVIVAKLALGSGKDDEAAAAYARADEQLHAAHASPRRLAQVDFGLAVLAYNKKDDAKAEATLAAVMQEDPSIYAAYLYAADLATTHHGKNALELLQKAVTYDPDNGSAWLIIGKLAQAAGNHALFDTALARLTALAPNGEGVKELKKLTGK